MNRDLKNLKVAITHDYLYEYGGAEQVLWELLKIFPSADIYTSIFRPSKKQRAFWFEVKKHRLNYSTISKLNLPKRLYKAFLFSQIKYFKNLDLSKYDLVISSSSAFAKYINTDKSTKHIAYIHTPPRFIWGYETAFYHKLPRIVKKLLKSPIENLKVVDKHAVESADQVLTNSKNIREKIEDVYGVKAQIIYPPVQMEKIINSKKVNKKNYYLTIGRLYDYKKIELIVQAFAELNKELVVIGDGPQRGYLEKIAGPKTTLPGFVDEEVKIKFLQEARGFIFAAEEDFGIVMVEALAAGTPVIAYDKGGAKEIVRDNYNGVLFAGQTSSDIIEAVKKFEKLTFDQRQVTSSIAQFSPENFETELYKVIDKVL